MWNFGVRVDRGVRMRCEWCQCGDVPGVREEDSGIGVVGNRVGIVVVVEVELVVGLEAVIWAISRQSLCVPEVEDGCGGSLGYGWSRCGQSQRGR